MTLSRRTLLQAPLVAAPMLGAKPPVRREVFLKAPGNGTAVMAFATYTEPRGGAMVSMEQRWSRSDTVDAAYFRTSSDYGKTWSAPDPHITGERRPEGMWRKHSRVGWVDPGTGRYIDFWLEGVLPNDDPLEGLRQWNLHYRVNGSSSSHQVIQKGREFDAKHPLPGVYAGKNCVMLGDQPSRPIALKGSILLPVDLTLIGADGKLANPGGGYTYHDSAVLHGRWAGDQIEWQMSARVQGDPSRTTRGVSEPTLAALPKGKLILVLRGSNDHKPDLPSYRWISRSHDGGFTWDTPVPWTYTDGSPFFSPSSCSQLVPHSSGRLFWLGNITPENPRGNRPRFPFVMAEVDLDTGLLVKDSVRPVDTLAPGEDSVLSLSNFFAREDRQTHEICVHMTRLFAKPNAWEGDAMLYRIAL